MGTAVLDQRAFMFGANDNSNPDSCTFDSVGVDKTIATGQPVMIRISVAEDGGYATGDKNWQLYFNTVDNPSTASQVTTSSTGVQMVNGDPADGTNLTTEKMAQAETWQNGEYCESDETDKLTLGANYNTEFQFCIQLTTGVTGPYYLYVRYNGAALDAHTDVPTISAALADLSKQVTQAVSVGEDINGGPNPLMLELTQAINISEQRYYTKDGENKENFDRFANNTDINSLPHWYSNAADNYIQDSIGLNSKGVEPGSNGFHWTIHSFDYTAMDTDDWVEFQGDFESNESGDFDDDRVGWTITPTDTTSDSHFGVQLDQGNVEAYWDGHTTGDQRPLITTFSGLTANNFYRLKCRITKIDATSVKIEVWLYSLNQTTGEVTGTVASGSIEDSDSPPDDATSSPTEYPNSKYFTSGLCPMYKNFNTSGHTDEAFDNATFNSGVGVAGVSKSVTESITIGESIDKLIPVLLKDVSDSISVSDSTSGLITLLLQAVVDSVDITDNSSQLLTPLLQQVVDSINITDSSSELIPVLLEAIVQSVDVTDTPSGDVSSAAPVEKLVTESITVSESISKEIPILIYSTSDSVTITDTSTQLIPILLKQLSDSVSVTDTPAGGVIGAVEKALSESVTVGESISGSVPILLKQLSDSINATESTSGRVLILLKQLQESITITDDSNGLLTELYKVVTDAISIDDTITPVVTSPSILYKALSDSITASDSINALLPKLLEALSESITVSDSSSELLLKLLKQISEGITVGESVQGLLPSLYCSITDSVTISESASGLLPYLNCSVSESVEVTETVGSQFTLLIASLVDSISVSEGLTLSSGVISHIIQQSISVGESLVAKLIFGQPDVPRNVSITVNDALGWSVDGAIKISGVDQDGSSIEETVTLSASAGTATFYTNRAFARVTDVAVTNVGDITAGSLFEIGYSDKVGLPNYISGEEPNIFKVTMDGVDIETPDYDEDYGTLDLETIPEGADYSVWYRF